MAIVILLTEILRIISTTRNHPQVLAHLESLNSVVVLNCNVRTFALWFLNGEVVEMMVDKMSIVMSLFFYLVKLSHKPNNTISMVPINSVGFAKRQFPSKVLRTVGVQIFIDL